MIDFVQVVSVEDYHDFDFIATAFRGSGKVKIHEYAGGLGNDRNYWGVLYAGKKPKKSEITKMLKDAGYMPMEDDGF